MSPSQPSNLLGGGDKSYLRDLIKFLIYTPINSPGLLAMCLKLYLPKDSPLSIDQGPGSHKLWEHVCGSGSSGVGEDKGVHGVWVRTWK